MEQFVQAAAGTVDQEGVKSGEVKVWKNREALLKHPLRHQFIKSIVGLRIMRNPSYSASTAALTLGKVWW